MIVRTYPVRMRPDISFFGGADEQSLLFFDIETTGFSARSSSLYLIGAVSFQNGGWEAAQWFAQSPVEEEHILKSFLEFASGFSHIIHFNGDRFDLPYLADKCRAFCLPDTLSGLVSHDIYRMAKPLKTLLNLPSLKQKSLEAFLGISREDRYHGGELIQIYHDYAQYPDDKKLELLLLHNYEDLLGMLSILPILSYCALIDGNWEPAGCEISGDEAVFCGTLPHPLAKPLSCANRLLSLSADGRALTFRVNGVRAALKHFFPDYKNYWYLPLEDTAIHKSVAAFVDKAYRKPAKASNCYVKKEGFYLPQNTPLFEPVFYEEYNRAPLYFACTESFLESPSLWSPYLKDLMNLSL